MTPAPSRLSPPRAKLSLPTRSLPSSLHDETRAFGQNLERLLTAALVIAAAIGLGTACFQGSTLLGDWLGEQLFAPVVTAEGR